MRSGFSAMRNRQAFWNNQRIGKTISGEFLDNFLKKTIIQNELANAKTFVLREEIKQILTQRKLRWNTIFIKSLILAQDERWRRA